MAARVLRRGGVVASARQELIAAKEELLRWEGGERTGSREEEWKLGLSFATQDRAVSSLLIRVKTWFLV